MGRVSPTSTTIMVGALKRMLDVLDPGQDRMALAALYRNLKRSARPSRDKSSRMAPARQLLELGLRLMETCGKGAYEAYVATRFRDGLTIAMLVSCPVRLKNLAMITTGRHLMFVGEAYELRFGATEMKTGRPYRAPLPRELTAYIDRYLKVYRPMLLAAPAPPEGLAADPGDALWIGRHGGRLTAASLRAQIELRTQAAFGAAIWPHLFRDCAVTELVDVAPDQIGLAPDLLGHGVCRPRRSTTSKPKECRRIGRYRPHSVPPGTPRASDEACATKGRHALRDCFRESSDFSSEGPMRAAIYARYSSEMQRDASIEDQVRLCRAPDRERGLDGGRTSTPTTASQRRVAAAARLSAAAGGCRGGAASTCVVAEALDRLSRDQEDIAALYKQTALRRRADRHAWPKARSASCMSGSRAR